MCEEGTTKTIEGFGPYHIVACVLAILYNTYVGYICWKRYNHWKRWCILAGMFALDIIIVVFLLDPEYKKICRKNQYELIGYPVFIAEYILCACVFVQTIISIII